MATEADVCMRTIHEDSVWRGAPCTDMKLENLDATGVSIIESVFDRAQLGGATFRGARIERSDFEQADLSGAIFDGSMVSAPDFSGADLRGAHFFDVYARAGDFSDAQMDGIRIGSTGAWGKTQFTKSCMYSASLRDAQISRALFIATDLRGADFTGASVTCVDLNGAKLNQVDFTNADLRGTYIGRDKPENWTDIRWRNTICPDGSNSEDHRGTCEGHFDFDPAEVDCASLFPE